MHAAKNSHRILTLKAAILPQMMPSHHNQTDAHGDTERHQQSVQHPHRPGDIILIRNIRDCSGKRHTGHQRNDRTDDHFSQMVSDPTLIQQNTKQSHQRAAGDICRDLGKPPTCQIQKIQIQNNPAANAARLSTDLRRTEAETGAAHSGGKNLMTFGFWRHFLDLDQPLSCLCGRVFSFHDLPGKLIDAVTRSRRPHSMNMADSGKVLLPVAPSGKKNSAAQHKGIAGFHTVCPGNPEDGLLHPKNFSAAGKQDIPCQSRHIQRFTPVLFLHFFFLRLSQLIAV